MKNEIYDFLIVGAGFFGSVFAYEASLSGKSCLVLEKRNHIGGNAYSEKMENINVHMYGPHIFHTNNDRIWNYINKFTEMKQFTYSPVARYHNEYYSLPFNMWTFNQLWGVKTPAEALAKIKSECIPNKKPKSIKEYAQSVLGKEVYEKLIKGYTEKQWQRDPGLLPSFIIKRLPFRTTYDNRYFNDKYCAMPVDGYTKIFERMLEYADVMKGVDYLADKKYWDSKARKIIYTGKIDEFYEYTFGDLDYRGLSFQHQTLQKENHQGVCVINHTSLDVPHTRTIEHKHFENSISNCTIVTTETPIKYTKNEVPYYPINDEKNNKIFKKYRSLAIKEKKYFFGGRLANYKYYNMDQVIASALQKSKNILSGKK